MSFKLPPKDALIRNKIFLKIHEIKNLEEYGLYKCERCNGTGLANYQVLSTGDHSWGGEFCSECDGIGVSPKRDLEVLIFDLFASYICSHCKGEGCSKCRNIGFVDWIIHARGG